MDGTELGEMNQRDNYGLTVADWFAIVAFLVLVATPVILLAKLFRKLKRSTHA